MIKLKCLFIVLLVICHLISIKACTIFNLSDSSNIIVGKSNAWGLKEGYITINPRNISKKGFVLGIDKSVKWTSKYGSLTFNQVSQEMPNGGINEKGLVVEILSSWADYSEKDNRKAINESQWIQFQLDNFETVGDVLKSEEYLRIRRAASDMHYFISDRYGNKATIDILNGKFKVHINDELKVPVLTNYPYENLISPDNLASNDSERRFLITQRIIEKNSLVNKELAWKIINRCKQNTNNYNVVYDLKNLMLFFNDPIYKNIKRIDILKLNFECGNTKVIPIQSVDTGLVNNAFYNFTKEMNKKQLDKVFSQLVKEGRIKGIMKVLTKVFYINKLNRLIKKQKCDNNNLHA